MKITPESELKKYSAMLEYWKANPKGHETTIKHLEVRVRYLELQVIAKKAYIRHRKHKEYQKRKEARNES